MRRITVSVLSIVVLVTTVGISQPALASSIHSEFKSLCSSAWSYYPISRGTDDFKEVGMPQSDFNGSKTVAHATFSAETAGTVSASYTGSADISLSVEIAAIAGHFSLATSLSKTTTIGNSIGIDIPAGKTGNGEYGVSRAYVLGREQFTNNACVVTITNTKNIYAPYKIGWKTWIS